MPNPKDPVKLEEYRRRMSEIAKERGYGLWMKGKKHSAESREKMSFKQREIGSNAVERELRSKRAKESGYGKWMRGKKLDATTVQKIAAHKRGKTYEEIYGDRSEEESRKRKEGNRSRWEGVPARKDARGKHNADYRYTEWRDAVFARDDYTCRVCSKRGGTLNAHHVLSWSKFPEKRYDIDNGLTVCANPCHKDLHRKR